MPNSGPTKGRIHMYQVGFGDCFLLSFEYPHALDDGRSERHVLIDFGSKPPPKVAGYTHKKVADLIAEHCGGQLDAIVITHRHQDHMGGFSDDDVVQVIDGLKPKLIVRPWTEDPKARSNAAGPRPSQAARFAARLTDTQEVLEQLEPHIARMRSGARADLRELAALAAAQKPNLKAMKQLDAWADGEKKGDYLHAGASTRLSRLLPNVTVRVLGPPTIKQHPGITKQKYWDKDEFWMAAQDLFASAATLASAGATPDGNRQARKTGLPMGAPRRVAERLAKQQVDLLLNVVHRVDDALNNTSLILLFDAGNKRLLFPGDAQLENWNYPLGRPEDCALLRDVDVYKVGHHGSRNATPKSLYNLWNEGVARPMVSLMSTMNNVYHKTEATTVPRKTLIEKLKERTTLVRTDTLPKSELFSEIEADLTSSQPFREV